MKHVYVVSNVIFITVIFLNFVSFFVLAEPLTACYFPLYTSCSSNLLIHRGIPELLWSMYANLNLG